MVKTTLTAENVVEANKLSNNYKVGARPVGGEHPWVPLYGRMGFFFFYPQKFLSAVRLQEVEEPRDGAAMGGPLGDRQGALLRPQRHPWPRRWVASGPGFGMEEVVWVRTVPKLLPVGSTVTFGNVLYLLLFGWWLSLLYVLVAALMFVTVVGAPYGESQIGDPLGKGLGSHRGPESPKGVKLWVPCHGVAAGRTCP